ncbi:hypothetical protein J4558_19580 [Leptolyngbya sp. 15MV]|nr:hypothetical protein J4558_19580 [Leptolyngbya sp. 15MV]
MNRHAKRADCSPTAGNTTSSGADHAGRSRYSRCARTNCTACSPGSTGSGRPASGRGVSSAEAITTRGTAPFSTVRLICPCSTGTPSIRWVKFTTVNFPPMIGVSKLSWNVVFCAPNTPACAESHASAASLGVIPGVIGTPYTRRTWPSAIWNRTPGYICSIACVAAAFTADCAVPAASAIATRPSPIWNRFMWQDPSTK